MNIHISRGGETFGPYTIEEFNEFVAKGNISANDSCWIDFSDWMSLRDIAAIFAWALPSLAPSTSFSLQHSAPSTETKTSGLSSPQAGIAAFSAMQNILIRQELQKANKHLEEIKDEKSEQDSTSDSESSSDFDF
jgi:hypothetical protein